MNLRTRQERVVWLHSTVTGMTPFVPTPILLYARNHSVSCNMRLVVRKPVFGVSDQVRHKPGCTATEDG